MAGEWIKVEIGLPEKPEVMRMARLLSIKRDEVVGVMVRFWAWAGANSVDGVVDGVVDADVDEVLSCPGLAASLSEVGWLISDKPNRRITIPNFCRHNGESSKKRALTNARQARWRNASVDAPPSTKASTREEKRREEVKKDDSASGGSTVWDLGKSILQEQGLSLKASGALIGSWLKEWDEPTVADAVRAAAGKADARSYIAKVLSSKAKKSVQVKEQYL